MDVTGIEPVTPCLQSKHKFNPSRCFGCAYSCEALLRLLHNCSNYHSRFGTQGLRQRAHNP